MARARSRCKNPLRTAGAPQQYATAEAFEHSSTPVIVYGDKKRVEYAGEIIARIAKLRVAVERKRGFARREVLLKILIEAGELVQGAADLDEAAGAKLYAPLLQLARAFVSDGRDVTESAVLAFSELTRGLPPLEVSRAEGFAYYSLYPEQYVAAARRVRSASLVVIGLRSIGTTLGAVVAAATDAELFVTVRPTGHPFRRELLVAPDIQMQLLSDRERRTYLVVDEGPGLSGSSMVAVGRWLEAHGIQRDQIVFLPSHRGGPGGEASDEVRAYWAGVRSEVSSFDELFLDPDAPVQLGDVLEMDELRDVSGGSWRAVCPSEAPVNAQQERRKFLGRRDGQRLLAKFCGLDAAAEEGVQVARVLGDRGYAPRVVDVRYGFTIWEWVDAASDANVTSADADRIADYLLFRKTHLRGERGAPAGKLLEMAEYNARGIADLSHWREQVAELERRRRPVLTDNRMHRWEWLRTSEGTLLKSDAADHAFAHDLIGAQDIAWDVAGGVIELGLDGAKLRERVGADEQLLEFYRDAYAAFHFGYYDVAAAGAPDEERERLLSQRDRYRAELTTARAHRV